MKSGRFLATAALAVLVLGGAALADDLGGKIDEAVQRETGGGFWGAILVARGGETLLAKGYGFADYADTPNTPRTLFEIASASKQFTAAAILRLEQDGKLDTSDPITKFFPDVPEDKRGITVHQLLTHTSGISPRVGVPYASTLDRPAWLKTVLKPALDSKPGTKFAYSNVGYALLAAIVEVVSKQPFEKYLEKAIFGPAGLADTGFIRDPDLLRSGRAASRLADGPKTWTAVDWFWGWGYRGMGGVVTTVLDLEKWDRALRGEKVLGKAAKEKLVTPALANYACGWMVQATPRGTTKAHHGGGVMGFGCYIVRFLDEDALIVILSNGKTNVHEIAATIENLLFPAARVRAVLDAEPYEMNEYRGAEFGGKLEWEVVKADGGIRVRLRDGKHTALDLRLPKGYERKVMGELASAIEARKRDDDGGPAAIEGGIYLNPYPDAGKRIEIDEGVAVQVLPQYVGQGEGGKRIVDRRAILIVIDETRRAWASIVKMNVAAAEKLLAGLRKASGS
jgi:CubicO group peptidase (beta-lactamase class C family)